MLNILIISSQFALTFLIGRSFYYFLLKYVLKNNKNKILNIDPYNFYLFFGLFIIGNLSVIFNFFKGVDNLFFKIILLSLVLLNLFIKPKFNFSPNFLLYVVPMYFLLILSNYNLGLNKDSDIYHLNHQLFIREEKIIIGLSNLHHRYGFSSIWEYILSNFWFGENLIFLITPNLIFLFNLYLIFISFILSSQIFYRKISIIFIIFGILDNFGFMGGRNGFFAIDEIGGFDNSFGILFFISSILIIYAFVNKNLDLFDFLTLGILIFFTGQIRYFGFILFIPFLFVLFKDIPKPFYKKSPIIFGGLLSFFWLLKNIIISGCFFYPVYQTCITSLSWFQPYQAKVVSLSIVGHPKKPNDIFVPISDFTWIQEWLPNNASYLTNYLICIIFIRILLYRKINNLDFRGISLALLLMLIWFFLTPAYRFAPPIFLTVLLLLNFDYLSDTRTSFLFKNTNVTILLALVVICAFLTVRLDSYRTFLTKPIESHKVFPNQIEYVSRGNYFGEKPVKGKTCYMNKNCFPDDYEVTIKNYKYFKRVEPVDINYWKKFYNEIENKKSI